MDCFHEAENRIVAFIRVVQHVRIPPGCVSYAHKIYDLLWVFSSNLGSSWPVSVHCDNWVLHKNNTRTLNLHNLDCTIEGNNGSSVSRDNSFSVKVTSIRLIASVHSNNPLESSNLGAVNAHLEDIRSMQQQLSILSVQFSYCTGEETFEGEWYGKDSSQLTNYPVDTPVTYSFLHENGITRGYLMYLSIQRLESSVASSSLHSTFAITVPELFRTNCRTYSRPRQKVSGLVCPNTGPSRK